MMGDALRPAILLCFCCSRLRYFCPSASAGPAGVDGGCTGWWMMGSVLLATPCKPSVVSAPQIRSKRKIRTQACREPRSRVVGGMFQLGPFVATAVSATGRVTLPPVATRLCQKRYIDKLGKRLPVHVQTGPIQLDLYCREVHS